MRNIEVVGLGALNMDHLYQVERILTDGEAVVQESILSPGGSAANTTSINVTQITRVSPLSGRPA